MTSVPESQLPLPVRFPKSSDTSSSLPTMKALLDSAVVRVRTTFKDADRLDCMAHNITMDMTESVHPEWVKSFVGHMSRRRELTTLGFRYLLQHAEIIEEIHLTQSICDRFVCNDAKPVILSTGQTVRSRSSEGASYVSTLKQHTTGWTEIQVLDLLKFNFKELARIHKGNQQPQLIVQNNEDLPYGLGVPVMNAESIMTWHSLKPAALLSRGLEPYLFVEFESKNNDCSRMLLYGASLVRWISRVCRHRFILPLLFINLTTGESELSYLYEDDNNIKVQYLRLSYNLNSLLSRLDLFATIYNIIDREPIETLHQILKSQLDYFKSSILASGLTTNTTTDDEDKNNEGDGDFKAIEEIGKKRSADGDGGRSGGGKRPRVGYGSGEGATRPSSRRGSRGGGRAGSKRGAGGSRVGSSVTRAASKRNAA